MVTPIEGVNLLGKNGWAKQESTANETKKAVMQSPSLGFYMSLPAATSVCTHISHLNLYTHN